MTTKPDDDETKRRAVEALANAKAKDIRYFPDYSETVGPTRTGICIIIYDEKPRW